MDLTRRHAAYIAAFGLLIAMAGLGLDIWLHARDDISLQSEDIFTLSNPGHVLFGAGLMLTALGVVLGLTAPLESEATLPGRLVGGAVVVLMAAVFAYGFSTADGGHSHDRLAADDHPTITDLIRMGLSQEEIALIETSRHSDDPLAHGPSLDLTLDQAVRLAEELRVARQAGERYASLDDALRDGYVQIVQDLPLIGAHFIHPGYTSDGVIDFSKPEMLIYTFKEGAWHLYGLSYLSRGTGYEGEVPPEGFAGEYDVWHWHKDWCFTLHGARAISKDECATVPGIFVERTGYMVHVWLVDNPEGLFSHSHPGLTGSDEYIVPILP